MAHHGSPELHSSPLFSFLSGLGSLNVSDSLRISSKSESTTYFWSLSGYLVLKNYRFKFSWFPDDVTGDLDIASGQTQLFRADTKWNVNQHYPHIPDHIVNNFFTPLPPLCFGSINCNSYVFLALIFTLDFIILFVFVIRIQPQTRFVQRLSFSSLDCV